MVLASTSDLERVLAAPPLFGRCCRLVNEFPSVWVQYPLNHCFVCFIFFLYCFVFFCFCASEQVNLHFSVTSIPFAGHSIRVGFLMLLCVVSPFSLCPSVLCWAEPVQSPLSSSGGIALYLGVGSVCPWEWELRVFPMPPFWATSSFGSYCEYFCKLLFYKLNSESKIIIIVIANLSSICLHFHLQCIYFCASLTSFTLSVKFFNLCQFFSLLLHWHFFNY